MLTSDRTPRLSATATTPVKRYPRGQPAQDYRIMFIKQKKSVPMPTYQWSSKG